MTWARWCGFVPASWMRMRCENSGNTSRPSSLMHVAAFLVVGCATTLASCATDPTSRTVEKGMILPDGAQQTELKPKQKFLMAAPIENRMPNSPSTSSRQPETTICVEFVVAEDGRVDSVRQIDAAPGCEKVGSHISGIFMPEVQSAVESWTYVGAALCNYDANEDECDKSTARLVPLAIKLAYKFKFTQLNGRRSVSSGTIE